MPWRRVWAAEGGRGRGLLCPEADEMGFTTIF